MVLPHQIFIPLRKKKRWNILIYYYEDASVTSLALILLLTCDWWMTEFNKVQSTLADWMKFGMQKYVEVCVLYGTVCVCDWGRCGGGFGGSRLWKINFKKPVLPLLRPKLQPLHFNVRCSLHYLWCFTPQNHGLPLSTSLRLSLPHIPIVTTSLGSMFPSPCVCIDGKRHAGWFGTSRHLMGDNMQEVQNQRRRSLNYHNTVLNFIYKHLCWLMGSFNCCRQRLQRFSQLSFWSFIYKFVRR